jgi:hypothetical protein
MFGELGLFGTPVLPAVERHDGSVLACICDSFSVGLSSSMFAFIAEGAKPVSDHLNP